MDPGVRTILTLSTRRIRLSERLDDIRLHATPCTGSFPTRTPSQVQSDFVDTPLFSGRLRSSRCLRGRLRGRRPGGKAVFCETVDPTGTPTGHGRSSDEDIVIGVTRPDLPGFYGEG